MSAVPVRTRVSVVPPQMERLHELGRFVGLLGVAIALPATAFAVVGGSAIAAGVAGFGVALVVVGAAFVRWVAPRSDVPLVATPGGLELGEQRITRDEIESAAIVGGGPARSTRVELVLRRGRTLRLELPSRLEARAVLDVLRLGARSRTMTRALESKFRGVVRTLAFAVLLPSASCAVVLLVFVLARGRELPPYLAELGTLVLLVTLGVGVLSTVPTRVTIGADVIVERWLGWSRTTPLDAIVRTEVLPRATGLCLHVPAKPRILWVGGGEALRRREVARLVERIESARIGRQPATPSAFRDWADRHASLDAAAWIDALRRDGDGYRETAAVPFSEDELWSALEDPRAAPTERAAAAIALAARVAEAERVRIRAVAESTAVDELAEVLERSAEDDDIGLAEAVGRLRTLSARAG